MREIKFRGKTNDGKWKIGYYYYCDWLDLKHRIRVQKDLHFKDFAVIEETLGELCYKKEDNEIYEKDIIKVTYRNGWYLGVIVKHRCCWKIKIIKGSYVLDVQNYKEGDFKYLYEIEGYNWEIVGNLTDNPELLEVR